MSSLPNVAAASEIALLVDKLALELCNQRAQFGKLPMAPLKELRFLDWCAKSQN